MELNFCNPDCVMGTDEAGPSTIKYFQKVTRLAATIFLILVTTLPARPALADDDGVRRHYLQEVPAEQSSCRETRGQWVNHRCILKDAPNSGRSVSVTDAVITVALICAIVRCDKALRNMQSAN